MSRNNTVYIGRKDIMTYVAACLESLSRTSQGTIAVKARGRSISVAVDVVEVLRRKFAKVTVDRIEIGTEVLGPEERNVSTIAIILSKVKT